MPGADQGLSLVDFVPAQFAPPILVAMIRLIDAGWLGEPATGGA